MKRWIFTMLPIAALAADLNAPVKTTPTIGSEIYRGVEAAQGACGYSAVDTLRYRRCIFDVENRSRQKLVDADPFDLGLFFAAWMASDITFTTLSSNRMFDPGDAYNSARGMYLVFRDLQRKLALTDNQVIAASRVRNIKRRLEFWSRQPPPPTS